MLSTVAKLVWHLALSSARLYPSPLCICIQEPSLALTSAECLHGLDHQRIAAVVCKQGLCAMPVLDGKMCFECTSSESPAWHVYIHLVHTSNMSSSGHGHLSKALLTGIHFSFFLHARLKTDSSSYAIHISLTYIADNCNTQLS